MKPWTPKKKSSPVDSAVLPRRLLSRFMREVVTQVTGRRAADAPVQIEGETCTAKLPASNYGSSQADTSRILLKTTLDCFSDRQAPGTAVVILFCDMKAGASNAP